MVESLAAMLDSVAAGKYPAPDGGITIMEQAPTRYAGVIGFTAHAVIFVDADPAWVSAQLPAGDLRWPLTPRFLQALCERTGRHAHSIDLLCAAASLAGPPPIDLQPEADPAHPRIARALRYRDDVRAWQADGGVLVLGRALAAAARHLVPGAAPLWAQIAAANAASVRAFLAAGFTPVGAEALFAAGLSECPQRVCRRRQDWPRQ